jgi:hypothetical protein
MAWSPLVDHAQLSNTWRTAVNHQQAAQLADELQDGLELRAGDTEQAAGAALGSETLPLGLRTQLHIIPPEELSQQFNTTVNLDGQQPRQQQQEQRHGANGGNATETGSTTAAAPENESVPQQAGTSQPGTGFLPMVSPDVPLFQVGTSQRARRGQVRRTAQQAASGGPTGSTGAGNVVDQRSGVFVFGAGAQQPPPGPGRHGNAVSSSTTASQQQQQQQQQAAPSMPGSFTVATERPGWVNETQVKLPKASEQQENDTDEPALRENISIFTAGAGSKAARPSRSKHHPRILKSRRALGSNLHVDTGAALYLLLSTKTFATLYLECRMGS